MRTVSFVLLALVAFSSAAIAAPADALVHELTVDEGADKQVILIQDEEPGFFEKYYPLTLNANNPAAADNIVPLWIGVLLPFGFLWSPYVFGDEKPGSDFIIDAIIIVLVHFVPYLLGFIPFVNILMIPLLIIYTWVNVLYLMPVAIINAYDRSLGSGGGGRSAPPPKRRKRRRRREASLITPDFAPTTGAVAF